MPASVITDPDDPRVAAFRRLTDSAYRRQVEGAGPFDKGIFVVEGWLAVERLFPSRYSVRVVLVDASKADRANEIIGRRHAPLLTASQTVLDEIVGFPLHRGIVAVAERGRPQLWTDVMRRGRRLVITEGVNDAENLGSIIRNAVALGGDGLLLDPTSCDPLTRRTVRVSVGHALALPFARLPWPDGLAELRGSGVTTVALTPRADAVPIDEVRIDPDMSIALVVGAEGPGLTDDAIDACDLAVRIPMARGIDSLNVASATAVAAHRLFAVGA
ncbi:MAG TPA: RNA methyltransferase [Microthrixaceae bacterium]|nr:RNA methyltransferase [Microthrixaceae bacterium]